MVGCVSVDRLENVSGSSVYNLELLEVVDLSMCGVPFVQMASVSWSFWIKT